MSQLPRTLSFRTEPDQDGIVRTITVLLNGVPCGSILADHYDTLRVIVNVYGGPVESGLPIGLRYLKGDDTLPPQEQIIIQLDPRPFTTDDGTTTRHTKQ